eukprot:scaffold135959_cov48-Phaeocystis_antarctica.AAC.1
MPAVDARHPLVHLGSCHERRQATHLRTRAARLRLHHCRRRAARGRLELGVGSKALELPAEVGLGVEVAPKLRLECGACEPRPHLDGRRGQPSDA